MKLRLATAALCATALLPGCLEFDAQDVHVHHDAESDRIDVMLVYRGLFAENGEVDDALAHWREAMREGDFAFWNNWPAKIEAVETNHGLLNRHLEIENGGAFTDPMGILCAYQFLRINDVSKMVTAGNGALALYVQANLLAKGVGDHQFDGDTKELVREHIRSRTPFVALDGSALRVELPLSAADHAWLMGFGAQNLFDGIAQDIRTRINTQRVRAVRAEQDESGEEEPINYNELRPPADSQEFSMDELERMSAESAWTTLLTNNPWSLIREAERTVLVLGIPGAPSQVLRKSTSGRYEPMLLDRMRQDEDIQVEDGVPDQELTRRFDEFRGRDPKLPPDYAAKLGR